MINFPIRYMGKKYVDKVTKLHENIASIYTGKMEYWLPVVMGGSRISRQRLIQSIVDAATGVISSAYIVIGMSGDRPGSGLFLSTSDSPLGIFWSGAILMTNDVNYK